MSRPIGRRCPNHHRRAWVLGPAWLWCPDCGAVSHAEPAEVEPGKWSRRWAYPGDNDKALDVQERWPRPKPKVLVPEWSGTLWLGAPSEPVSFSPHGDPAVFPEPGTVTLKMPAGGAVYDGFTGERLLDPVYSPRRSDDPETNALLARVEADRLKREEGHTPCVHGRFFYCGECGHEPFTLDTQPEK